MLCVNRWSRGGRYYGSSMDALHEQMWALASAENTVPTVVFGM